MTKRRSWDETWMRMAKEMSGRSACIRRRVGAVIVSPDNRLIASSYNGPPSGYVGGQCIDACPRGRGEVPPTVNYDSCIALHAEQNALMFNDRRDSLGGTIYVTSAICNFCAKLIANSGLKRVVMLLDHEHDQHRDPTWSIALLEECGLEVIVNRKKVGGYRRDFYEAHGLGPHDCFFCEQRLPVVEIVHHIDGDRKNNASSNLAPCHKTCHTQHHMNEDRTNKKRGPNKRTHRNTYEKCPGCDLVTALGPLGRHRKATGH